MDQNQQPTQPNNPGNTGGQTGQGGYNPRGGFQGGGQGFGGGAFGQGGRGRGRGDSRGGRKFNPNREAKSEFDQKVLDIARVTRVTKGGKRFSFRTTVVIGDGKSRVGMGIGKGIDVAQSMQKAFNKAKKDLITVPIKDGTIPYQVEFKFHSAVVLLKPAKGGVKAGGPVRVVAKLAGIKALTGKLVERTNSKINIARATLGALKQLRMKAPVVKAN
jgi:small subunit ribosomal protein S5